MMNDGQFMGLLLLIFGSVLMALSWPVTITCCYCAEPFDRKATIAERLFSGFAEKCHYRCFMDRHPILPPVDMPRREPPTAADIINRVRTAPFIGDQNDQ